MADHSQHMMQLITIFSLQYKSYELDTNSKGSKVERVKVQNQGQIDRILINVPSYPMILQHTPFGQLGCTAQKKNKHDTN